MIAHFLLSNAIHVSYFDSFLFYALLTLKNLPIIEELILTRMNIFMKMINLEMAMTMMMMIMVRGCNFILM